MLTEACLVLLEYQLTNDTRWAPHWGHVQERHLENYPNTRRMSEVIEQNSSTKVKKNTKAWREYCLSNDFGMYITITRDYFKQIMNINDKTNQLVTFRFPGDFQWHDKNEIKNTQNVISNFGHLINFVNMCNLFQWMPNYEEIIMDFIDNNLNLFEHNDMLRLMFPDILSYQFFGFKTNNWDPDSCDVNDENYNPQEDQSHNQINDEDEPGEPVDALCKFVCLLLLCLYLVIPISLLHCWVLGDSSRCS